jgi:DnaJ family protein C protein 11
VSKNYLLDPEAKKNAEVIFNKLKTAHQILTDPEKRNIYDLLGMNGLQTEDWELIHR